MTRIKICGLTNADDALAVARFGADALGFIAVPDTPRFVSPETLAAISRALPPFALRVVVVRELIDAVGYGADAIQFYDGDGTGSHGLRRVRAFRIRDEESLNAVVEYRHVPNAVLLDAFHEGALGGAGRTFDWRLAVRAKAMLGDIPLILAGGLTPENVGDAIRAVRPYAVDVSSGVEAEPGRKDHDKIRRFVAAVRDVDRALSPL